MSLSHHPSIVKNGLVLYLDAANKKSYPGNASLWTDLTKNKIILSLTATTFTENSLNFNGSTSYASFATNSDLTIGTSNFTMEMWIRPTARSQTYPVLLYNNYIGTGWSANLWQLNDRHANNPTKFTFWCYNYNVSSAMLVSSTSVVNNTWYHLVISRISNNFSMYLNSKLETSVTSSVSIDGGLTRQFGFSGLGGGQYNGLASIIKIYNSKGLTSNEILQNYNATKSRYGY
jgi:hypothetical protein